MKRYQICKREDEKAVPVDWTMLPDSEAMIEAVDSEYMYNVMTCTPEGNIELGTVLYFKPVRSFKKGLCIVEHPEQEIAFGV